MARGDKTKGKKTPKKVVAKTPEVEEEEKAVEEGAEKTVSLVKNLRKKTKETKAKKMAKAMKIQKALAELNVDRDQDEDLEGADHSDVQEPPAGMDVDKAASAEEDASIDDEVDAEAVSAELDEAVKKAKSKISKRLEQLEQAGKDTASGKKGKKKTEADSKKGVVYLGHIPYGFVERGMRAFFGQFGHVTRVKLVRSTKSARSKGYGWIEFNEKDVAEVVAEAMNNYILFGKQLVCKVVPTDEVKEEWFHNCDKKFKYIPRDVIFRSKYNKPKDEKMMYAKVANLIKNEEKKRETLKKLGITYEFPGFAALIQ